MSLGGHKWITAADAAKCCHDPDRWRRFVWTGDDLEGMALTTADGTVIPLGDADDEENEL